MDNEQLDVKAYLPQSEPIIMIGGLIATNDKVTTTELLVTEDNIFVENECLSEAGIVENIAQTAALHAGYHRPAGDEVLIGFIGALKNLEIHHLPKVGDTLNTTIEIIHEVLGATIIKGSTTCENQEIAACEMKIFLQQQESE